jgi:hypothetical protein
MKRLLVLAILISVFSCREDPTQLNRRDLIPKNKLISMLTEMHLIDALTNNNELNAYFPAGDSVDIYAYIFKKYGVTSAQFDTTIAAYSRRPDLFLKIYNEVIFRLNNVNDTANKSKPKITTEPSTTFR